MAQEKEPDFSGSYESIRFTLFDSVATAAILTAYTSNPAAGLAGNRVSSPAQP